jgi:thiol-disulfide isomerase/thioredoxin
VRALITGEAPAGEIDEETDLAAPGIPQVGSVRSLFYLEVARTLLRRGEAAPMAVAYARNALQEIPPDEARPEVAAFANGVLGQALLANGDCRPAIETLGGALGTTPDSQDVLSALGAAYEACGEPGRAIDHYVRALGVYGGTDSSAAAPLRRLYAAEHGSLAGLDERIRKAYESSMRLQVFEERRYEAPMPAWSMEDTSGTPVRSEDLAGRVIVLDFWGSWCGPCRMELPHFQAMYEKYRDQDVVFYGVNWERLDRSKRKAQALAYLKANDFDFPNVFDLDDSAAHKFQVTSFPTVFLVDHTGNIRYRNIGFTEGIGEIMSLQIESLIEERKKARTAKK